MSRPIIDALKAIFIHVPKTGGVSIDRYLHDHYDLGGFSGHHPAKLIRATDPEKFSSYFKFAFVRNPWDRLVSAFYFLSQGGYSKIDKVIIEKYIAKYAGNFSHFVRDLPDNLHFVQAPELSGEFFADGLPFDTSHFIEQVYWVCDNNGALLVDYLGRFESLASDFQILCGRLGTKEVGLAPSNSSNHAHYRSCYTDETAAIVGQLYKQDIETFAYEF